MTAVGSGQMHRRKDVAFPDAPDAWEGIVGLLIGRTCVPSHAHLAVVGANEIGKQVEIVGREVEYFPFDSRGLGDTLDVRGTPGILGLAHRLEPFSPRTEQSLMLRLVTLKNAKETERTRQFMPKAASLVTCADAVHVLALHGQAWFGAFAISSRRGRSSA